MSFFISQHQNYPNLKLPPEQVTSGFSAGVKPGGAGADRDSARLLAAPDVIIAVFICIYLWYFGSSKGRRRSSEPRVGFHPSTFRKVASGAFEGREGKQPSSARPLTRRQRLKAPTFLPICPTSTDADSRCAASITATAPKKPRSRGCKTKTASSSAAPAGCQQPSSAACCEHPPHTHIHTPDSVLMGKCILTPRLVFLVMEERLHGAVSHICRGQWRSGPSAGKPVTHIWAGRHTHTNTLGDQSDLKQNPLIRTEGPILRYDRRK